MTHDQSKPLEPNQPQPEAQPEAQLQPTDPPPDETASSVDSEVESNNTANLIDSIESSEPVDSVEPISPEPALANAPTIPVAHSEPTIAVPDDAPEGDIDDLDGIDGIDGTNTVDVTDDSVEAVLAPEPPAVATSATSIGPSSPPSQPSTVTPPPAEPSSAPSKTQALFRLVGQLWGIFVALLPILGRFLKTVWQGVSTVLKWIYATWKAILPRLRSLLPAGWNKLPDWVLTTVAVSLLIFLFWLTAQLSPGKPPALAGDRTPATLKAPAPAQPVAPTPDDPVLIARIQEQVAEVTNEYAEGLIQSVQANFRGDRLIVQVSDDWFDLDLATQNKLAAEMLNRSHQLEFDKLEIVDSEGELLARSPVVGSKMVIYEGLKG